MSLKNKLPNIEIDMKIYPGEKKIKRRFLFKAFKDSIIKLLNKFKGKVSQRPILMENWINTGSLIVCASAIIQMLKT